MLVRLLAAALAAGCVMVGVPETASAKTTLKMATQAPPRSPWGKVFRTWSKAVDQKTKGEVVVDWLWNGTAGPESAVVGKIKSGQLDGGAITAVGLSSIDKRFLALQVPGAFKSWGELDSARNKIAPELIEAAKKDGFHIAGFGDVGKARVFSKGFAVKSPEDLKGKRPAQIREDLIAPKVYEAIGGVSSVPGDIATFLPMLNAGRINVMITPALAAELLQWASRLDHMNSHAVAFSIGAVVMSQKQLDKLPADQREVVNSTGKQAAAALTKSIRREDDKAYERLSKKMTTHTATDAEKAEWQKVFKRACERLKGAIPGGALTKVGAC